MPGTQVFGRHAKLLCAAALGLSVSVLVVACGEEGETPDCPALPLYNVREEVDDAGRPTDPAKRQTISEAATKGCVTLPGSAVSVRDATAG